jgi:hypothetical protein
MLELLSLVFEVREVFRVATALVANNINHIQQMNENYIRKIGGMKDKRESRIPR